MKLFLFLKKKAPSIPAKSNGWETTLVEKVSLTSEVHIRFCLICQQQRRRHGVEIFSTFQRRLAPRSPSQATAGATIRSNIPTLTTEATMVEAMSFWPFASTLLALFPSSPTGDAFSVTSGSSLTFRQLLLLLLLLLLLWSKF